MPNDLKWKTAVHEAGHAVIGRVLGLPCGAVTIVAADEHELGHAEVDDPVRYWQRGDGPRRALVEASVQCLYAGAEAERLICKSSEVGDGPDCSKARGLIQLVGVRGAAFVQDDIWEKYEDKLRSRSRSLVERHRNTIEAVAITLYNRNSLQASEVDALVRTGSPSPNELIVTPAGVIRVTAD